MTSNGQLRLAAQNQPESLCVTHVTLTPADLLLCAYEGLGSLEIRCTVVPKALQEQFINSWSKLKSVATLKLSRRTKLDCGILCRKLCRGGFINLKNLELKRIDFESNWMLLLSKVLPHLHSLRTLEFHLVNGVELPYVWIFNAAKNIQTFCIGLKREFLLDEVFVLCQTLETTKQMNTLCP